jgi:hypothetical protein
LIGQMIDSTGTSSSTHQALPRDRMTHKQNLGVSYLMIQLVLHFSRC